MRKVKPQSRIKLQQVDLYIPTPYNALKSFLKENSFFMYIRLTLQIFIHLSNLQTKDTPMRNSLNSDTAGLHGLPTANEGINQMNLKIWADVAVKICFGHTLKFGSGS